MLKSDLVQILLKLNPNLSEAECSKLVGTFFGTISNRLVDGGDIELRGFGRIFLSRYPERVIRNPKTGKLLCKQDSLVVRFRAGKALNALINK